MKQNLLSGKWDEYRKQRDSLWTRRSYYANQARKGPKNHASVSQPVNDYSDVQYIGYAFLYQIFYISLILVRE